MKLRLKSKAAKSREATVSGNSSEALRLRGGAGKYDVFISFVAEEAKQEASDLQRALEKEGKKTFAADDIVEKGELDELIDALDASKLVVILGTRRYGIGATKEQLAFIVQEAKPFLLVKMAQRFEAAKTRYHLNRDIPSEAWKPGSELPGELVDTILQRLDEASVERERPVDGFGEFVYPNRVRYIGLWRNGEPNGLGRQEYYDGSVFEGMFRNGYREGLGKYTYGEDTLAPGDVFEGNYLRGKRDGQGKYVYNPNGPNAGDMYMGGWRNGKRHGYGTYFYSSGDRYHGQWVEGRKHGQGMYTYAGENEGDVFTGEYKNDVREGKGEFRYKNGDCYSGGWARNNKNGKGVFVFAASGNRYNGNWKDGYMEGYGEFFWGAASGSHGASYKGQWKKGKRHGSGVFTDPSGQEQRGTWVDGALTS